MNLLKIRDYLNTHLSLRIRLWLKLSATGLIRGLRQPRGGHWGRFFRSLAAHPFSRQVRGGPPNASASALTGAKRAPRLAIFLMPCCWQSLLPPFVQLGEAMRRRGFDVGYVSGHAGFCSYFGTVEGWTAQQCANQLQLIGERILVHAGPLLKITDYVTTQSQNQAAAWVAAQRQKPLGDLVYRGWNVWELIKGSYGRQRSQRVNLQPDARVADLPGVEALLHGFVIAHEAIGAFLDQRRPDAVMIFNGLFYQERLISELARRRGIRVLAHENSCFADRKIFDPAGYVGNYTSVVSATWPSVRDRVLSAAQRNRLEDYLAGVYRGAQNTIRQSTPAAADQLRRQLNLSAGDRIALLLGQVPFDTVIIYDLHIFQSQLEFLSRTIEIFRDLPDYTLVVRLHPWEHEKFGDRTYQELRRLDLPPNVRFVNGREMNTYSLMRLAEFGITATSQSGLEMLSLMKPLVVAGEAFYAHKGFTHDVPSAAVLGPIVREVAAHPVLEEHQRRIMRSFLYHLIFEHQIAFDRENGLFPPASIDRIERLLRSGSFAIEADC